MKIIETYKTLDHLTFQPKIIALSSFHTVAEFTLERVIDGLGEEAVNNVENDINYTFFQDHLYKTDIDTTQFFDMMKSGGNLQMFIQTEQLYKFLKNKGIDVEMTYSNEGVMSRILPETPDAVIEALKDKKIGLSVVHQVKTLHNIFGWPVTVYKMRYKERT